MAAVPDIKEIHAGQQTNVTKKSNNSKLFDADLVLEQADALLKNTGQYARWQHVRQNNDKAALWLGKRLLERHELVEKWQKGQSVDRTTFDHLTAQLKNADIHLYTFRQLQQASAHQAGRAAPPSASSNQQNPVTSQAIKSTLPPSQSTHPSRVAVSYPVVSSDSQLTRLEPSPLSPSAPVTSLTDSAPSSSVAAPAPVARTAPSVTTTSVPAVGKASLQSTVTASVPLPDLSAQAIASSHPVVSPSILDDENLLILDLQCPQIGLQDTIFGYADAHTVMLPFSSIMQGLDFSISVDPDKGTASGWFISEDRSFLLDVNKQQVVINGTGLPLSPGSVINDQYEIYVSAKNMASWFPLDFDISRSELTVTLTPLEQLPQQARLEREQRHLGISSSDIPLKYPVQPLEYDLFSLPVVDVNLSSGTGTKDLENTYLNGRYSILAQGDLAYMTSHIFASGYEDSLADTARIRLERVSPDAELLGPLHATRIAVGDILPATFPVLQNATPERGVFLSNEDLIHSMDHDTTRFEGNLQPGWEVELYQNGSLMHGKIVGMDGRYLFDEVPVYFGKNDFVIKAYGPQGQQKILQEKSIRVGSQMLPQGNSLYRMSASQRDKTMLGIEEQYSLEQENSGRFNGRYQYGLTKNLSIGAGLSSVEFGEERHNYIQAGLSGNASFVYGEADYLYDTATGGSGLSLLGQTAIGSLNIKAKHEFFSDFVMESRPSSTLESKTRVDLKGNIVKTALTPSLSYTLSSENTQYTDHDTASLSNRLSARIRDIYLSNYLVWNYGNYRDDNPFDGQLQATGNIGPVRVTGSVKYRFGDDTKVTRYGISSQWQVGENLRTGLDLVQDTDYYNRTTASAKLDWDAGVAIISPRVSYDSEGKFGAFLNLSFSLGRDPVAKEWDLSSTPGANRGNVSTLVYHDQNNNKLFDEEDTLLSDVTVKAVQGRQGALTGDNGYALVSGLQPYVPTDVEVDLDTLEDPFWIPSTEGVAIRPRPGHYDQMEIPIVTGGEIDGTVFLTDKNGVSEPLANVTLEIVDHEGNLIKTIRSEYDGFYLFDKVLPGTYTLRVSPEDEEHASLAAGLDIPITIGNDGTIVSGTDIILQDPNEIILHDLRDDNESLLAGIPSVESTLSSSQEGLVASSQQNVDTRTGEAPVQVQPAEDVRPTSIVAQQVDEPTRLWPDPMDFFVTPTGVIDGTVYVRNQDGERRALANVALEVVDEEGTLVETTRSESDGFYVFENLMPGTYTLQVSQEDEQYASLAGGLEESILIGNDTTIVRGTNLVFQDPAPVPQPVVAQADEQERERMVAPEETLAMQQQTSLLATTPVQSQSIAPSQIVTASGKKEAVVAEANAVRERLQGDPGEQNHMAAVPSGLDRVRKFSSPPVLPVVEYTLAAARQDSGLSGLAVTGRQRADATAEFSVMPQPIVPFTPIQMVSAQPVRRINPYATGTMGNRQDSPISASPRQGTGTRWQGLKIVG